MSNRLLDFDRIRAQEGLIPLPVGPEAKWIEEERHAIALLSREDREERNFIIRQLAKVEGYEQIINTDNIVAHNNQVVAGKREAKEFYNKKGGQNEARQFNSKWLRRIILSIRSK